MNISLTPQLEVFVKQKVASGMYHSVSEVIRDALRLLEEKETLKNLKMEALKSDINQGLESLENRKGKPLDIKAIKAKGRQIMTDRDQD